MRLPYDLLDRHHTISYNVDDYATVHFSILVDIRREVQSQLLKSKTAMAVKQNRYASPVTLQPGDSVMILAPERQSKLSSKFDGPRVILKRLHGNKFEVFDPLSLRVDFIRNDRLKHTVQTLR